MITGSSRGLEQAISKVMLAAGDLINVILYIASLTEPPLGLMNTLGET
ncbi:hypothetical protein [uncultured Nostoc sp.]|nr:hypothetical protein [uncultured Nostoc sp.]